MELSEPSGHFSALVGSPAAIGFNRGGISRLPDNDQPYDAARASLSAKAARKNMSRSYVTGGIRNIYQPAIAYDRIPPGHIAEL